MHEGRMDEGPVPVRSAASCVSHYFTHRVAVVHASPGAHVLAHVAVRSFRQRSLARTLIACRGADALHASRVVLLPRAVRSEGTVVGCVRWRYKSQVKSSQGGQSVCTLKRHSER